MNKLLRRRILNKMAQMEPPANLPIDEATKPKVVSGSPNAFNITEYYPGLENAFGGTNFNWIKRLVDIINQALYYTSDGKIELKWMQNNNFSFDTSSVYSVDLKNLMGFAKQLHDYILTNNGKKDAQPLNSIDISKRIAPLKSSNFISNLSTSNPMGQLQSKIGGNVKTLINDILAQIK